MNENRFDGLIKSCTETLFPACDWRIIKAQVAQESAFNPEAKSPCGALGLLQLMPATAWQYFKLTETDLLFPEKNLPAGVKYLLIQYIHLPEIPDHEERVKFALASYSHFCQLPGFAPLCPAGMGSLNSNSYSAGLAAVSEAIFGHPNASESEISAAIEKGLPAEAIIALQKQENDCMVQLRQLANENEKNRLNAETLGMQEETKRITAINQTMEAEGKSEHWAQWSWRPYWGFVTGTAFLAVATLICYLAYLAITTRDHDAMRMIPDLIVSFAEFFAIPGAILGVTAWHRGRLQRIRAGEQKNLSLMDALKTTLIQGKGK